MERWNRHVFRQFGAALDALKSCIESCPETLWGDRERFEFWYRTYHALFFADYYLSSSPEDFSPPEPFTLSELDPTGVLPERVYSKPELLTYLEHCRQKCRLRLDSLTDVEASRRSSFFKEREIGVGELFLYNMRHVQHHAAQLNVLLRRETGSAPGWKFTAST